MIRINESISLEEKELDWSFVRSSGPGGQNVNKVATAVQLRFDAAHSASLPEAVRGKLLEIAGSKATSEGVILIDARRHRSQELNRKEALNRLIELVRRAARKPKARRPTKPSRSSKKRRVERKRRRGSVKRLRGRVESDE
jgi:ribosome-associated protein